MLMHCIKYTLPYEFMHIKKYRNSKKSNLRFVDIPAIQPNLHASH